MRTSGKGHGFTGIVSGTGIVVVSRGLHEPWPTVVAAVAPTVSVAWAFIQAAVFDKIDDWQATRTAARAAATNRRGIAELKAALAEAMAETEAMEPGEARSKQERELKEVAAVIGRCPGAC